MDIDPITSPGLKTILASGIRLLNGNWRLAAPLIPAALMFELGLVAFAQAVPTFVDVPTFAGAPLNKNLDSLSADFAVLGVPFDEGTWGWPGERYGPRALREASQEYNHELSEGFRYGRTLGSRILLRA